MLKAWIVGIIIAFLFNASKNRRKTPGTGMLLQDLCMFQRKYFKFMEMQELKFLHSACSSHLLMEIKLNINSMLKKSAEGEKQRNFLNVIIILNHMKKDDNLLNYWEWKWFWLVGRSQTRRSILKDFCFGETAADSLPGCIECSNVYYYYY